MSSKIQHSPQINKATFKEGIKRRAILKPATQTMPATTLVLLSYTSRSFSIHNFVLNAIIHLPIKVVINVEYTSEQIANTHTLYLIKHKYIPSPNPSKDSVIHSTRKYFIAFCLMQPFHIIPTNSPARAVAKDSNAIHSAGNSVIIALVTAG